MELIGVKVTHKKFGSGIIAKIDNGILIVKFNEREVNFQYPSAFETFLVAEDDNVQNYMLEQISAVKKAADEERLAKELKRKEMELAAQAREEEKSKSKSSTSKTVVFQRIEGKRMIYYVFQGNTFDKEFRGGYIWAPVANKAGLKPHHWTRLLDVRKDDIILHGCDGYIKAVSVAKDKCYECKQPDELKTEELWDMEGRRIDCDYTLISNPVKTSIFVDDIIRLCRVKYSPFDKDGNGNMGYLYEINRELAKIFIKALVKNNNSLTNIDYINEVLAEEDII